MTGRGRGRPSLFTDDLQAQYLDLVAAGVRLGAAALKLGMDRRRITYAKNTQPAFARRLADARARGRTARLPHGRPGTYTNHGCRCPPCTTAATRARAQAPDRRYTTGTPPRHPDRGEDPPAANVLPLTPRTLPALAHAS